MSDKPTGRQIINIIDNISLAVRVQKDTLETAIKDLADIEKACDELPAAAEYESHEDLLEDLFFWPSEGGFTVKLSDGSYLCGEDVKRFVPWLELIVEPQDLELLDVPCLENVISNLNQMAAELQSLATKAEEKLSELKSSDKPRDPKE